MEARRNQAARLRPTQLSPTAWRPDVDGEKPSFGGSIAVYQVRLASMANAPPAGAHMLEANGRTPAARPAAWHRGDVAARSPLLALRAHAAPRYSPI